MMKCTELAKKGNRSLVEIMNADTERIEKYVVCSNFDNAKAYGTSSTSLSTPLATPRTCSSTNCSLSSSLVISTNFDAGCLHCGQNSGAESPSWI